jgi:hypothetical protein
MRRILDSLAKTVKRVRVFGKIRKIAAAGRCIHQWRRNCTNLGNGRDRKLAVKQVCLCRNLHETRTIAGIPFDNHIAARVNAKFTKECSRLEVTDDTHLSLDSTQPGGTLRCLGYAVQSR